jgi:hypothetical protein
MPQRQYDYTWAGGKKDIQLFADSSFDHLPGFYSAFSKIAR